MMMANILGTLGVVNVLDLDQARLGRHGVLATLVAQVTTPKVVHMLARRFQTWVVSSIPSSPEQG